MSSQVLESIGSMTPEPGQRATRRRRLLEAYLNGGSWLITALAFVCALIFGAILIAAADAPTRKNFSAHPTKVFSSAWSAISAGYAALFRGSIFNFNSLHSNATPLLGPLSDTLVNAAPLILGGLAVTVAFRAGLFNIGVQGQIIMGAICSGYVGFTWHMPAVLHVIVATIAGILGGLIWGLIVGLLKARTGAHEVITTIMLNYVAFYFLGYLLGVNGFQKAGSSTATSPNIDASADLPKLFDDLHSGILLAAVSAVACWWLLSRSTLGFRLKAVGANAYAARTAGMSVERSYVTVMAISGALAGLVGVSQVLGTRHVVTQDVDAGFGFDAITVALLGRSTPGGTVLAGLLFGAFRAGGLVMATDTNTPADVVSVIEPVMVLFIAAPALVAAIFRIRARSGGPVAAAKGWNG